MKRAVRSEILIKSSTVLGALVQAHGNGQTIPIGNLAVKLLSDIVASQVKHDSCFHPTREYTDGHNDPHAPRRGRWGKSHNNVHAPVAKRALVHSVGHRKGGGLNKAYSFCLAREPWV